MSANQTVDPRPAQQPAAEPRYLSPREQRRARRDASGGWAGGLILVLLGLIFLLQSLGVPLIGNWWALFVLLPAIATLGAALNRYVDDGGIISGAVIAPAIVGLGFVALAGALFFNIDVGRIWPIGLIVVGVGVFIAGLLRPSAS